MYQSTFVRYERRGDRVVPVRVTKSWVTAERKDGTKVNPRFTITRVTECRTERLSDREPALDAQGKPVAWVSSSRVESRERLLTLSERGVKDGEPLVREAGYDQRWLPYSVPAQPTKAQAGWSLDNGNGWVEPRAPRAARQIDEVVS